MPDLIDREKAISTLEKIKAEHAKRTCSRASLQQAQALGYAIAVIRKLPKENG